MNLYLLKRSPACYVQDAFDYIVVAAETPDQARYIHPTRGVTWKNESWTKGTRDYGLDMWTTPSKIRSHLLGKARKGTKPGMLFVSLT